MQTLMLRRNSHNTPLHGKIVSVTLTSPEIKIKKDGRDEIRHA
jgi:hypothetical protein